MTASEIAIGRWQLLSGLKTYKMHEDVDEMKIQLELWISSINYSVLSCMTGILFFIFRIISSFHALDDENKTKTEKKMKKTLVLY